MKIPADTFTVTLDLCDWQIVEAALTRAADQVHHCNETTCLVVGRRRLRQIASVIQSQLPRAPSK